MIGTGEKSNQGDGPAGRAALPWPGLPILIWLACGLASAALAALLFALSPPFAGLDMIVWGLAGLAVICLGGLAWTVGAKRARAGELKHLLGVVRDAREAQLVTDGAGRQILANTLLSQMLHALGPPGPDLLDIQGGEILDDLAGQLPTSQGAGDLARLRGSAAAGRRDECEIQVTDGDGWWRITVQPLAQPAGYVLWAFANCTERHQREAARRQRDALAGDLLGNLPVGIFSVDGEGRLVYYNGVLAGWLGLDAEDGGETNLKFADYVADSEEDPVMADATGMHGGLTLKGADGEAFNVYLIQSQREEDDGGFLYSRSVVLREPFAPVADDGTGLGLIGRYPWLFADVPVGIVLLDLHANVIECNRAVLKMLGLHRDALINQPLAQRISAEDRDDVTAQLSKVVMGIMPAAMLDARLLAGGEKDVMATLYVSRVQDSEGEITGLALHVVDITEQKNLEVQFNQSQKMQAVGQLAGGVAHDFNNLLTAMIGFCDLLLTRHQAEDPSFADIMQIKQNANRAANLVRQLLAFSRRQTLQPKTLSVAAALDDLTGLLTRLIGENIDLDIAAGSATHFIRIDPGQFDQVIINLVVNARDAMRGGGSVTINTQAVALEQSLQKGHEVMPAGAYVLITVMDTGGGIAKENIGLIFDPFFSTKGVGEGTGLGLSTVYGIIRQSEGYIFVDSAKGEGTTFSIYLPAYADIQTPDGEFAGPVGGGEQPSEPADLTGGGTVLLVEDEDAVRLFGSRALRNKGYVVLEANDGEDALDVINDFDGPIDLIITDVVMPGMDGHTLVGLVRQEIPDIRVILMSGYAEEAIPGEISHDGTIHFLPKPFSLEDLALKVKTVIKADS